jgi:hypothetical protein
VYPAALTQLSTRFPAAPNGREHVSLADKTDPIDTAATWVDPLINLVIAMCVA